MRGEGLHQPGRVERRGAAYAQNGRLPRGGVRPECRDGRPEAVVRLDARLVHTATRRIVASHSFALRAPATDTAVPAVVQAFGAAADRLAAEVVEWTVREGSAAK